MYIKLVETKHFINTTSNRTPRIMNSWSVFILFVFIKKEIPLSKLLTDDLVVCICCCFSRLMFLNLTDCYNYLKGSFYEQRNTLLFAVIYHDIEIAKTLIARYRFPIPFLNFHRRYWRIIGKVENYCSFIHMLVRSQGDNTKENTNVSTFVPAFLIYDLICSFMDKIKRFKSFFILTVS